MNGENNPPSPPPETASSPDISQNQEDEEEQVMSEIHIGCPPKLTGPFISYFTFSLPHDVEYNGSKYEHQVLDDSKRNQEVSLDDDGDLALPRRSKRSKNNFVVAVQHNITSSIPKVGLQMFTSSEFDGIVALELGAGTGLVGMLLARVAKTVYLTDHGFEILENCSSNVHLNSALIPSKASVNVRGLDWKAYWPPQQSNYPSHHSYAWNLSELEELERASLLVAADVIYSDDLMDALFTTLERLMSRGLEKVLYLALEKRYNFSVDDLDVVANGYSRFRSYVRDENEQYMIQTGSSCVFIGTRLDLTKIPQYANDYIRGEDVELWQIKYAREEENL